MTAKQAYRDNPFQGVLPNNASFVIGEEAADVIAVSIQLKDGLKDLAQRAAVDFYLSTNANGDNLLGTAPDGGIAIGTDGVLIPYVADIAGKLVSEVDGDIDITIEESGAATYYLVLVLPDGTLKVSGAITFAA